MSRINFKEGGIGLASAVSGITTMGLGLAANVEAVVEKPADPVQLIIVGCGLIVIGAITTWYGIKRAVYS